MKGVFECQIKYNQQVGENLFLLGLRSRRDLKLVPGQFFMLRAWEGFDPLLNRPLSWFRFFPGRGLLEFVYQVLGRGTKILSERHFGEEVRLIGPLGKGFELKGLSGRILLIAGGVGMAGLWSLAEQVSKKRKIELNLIWGAKSKSRFFLQKEIPKRIKVHLTTEDGSVGKKGLATDLVREWLTKNGAPDHIFACGPKQMLLELARLTEPKRIPGQVLYEERMACGVGACLGCSVPAKGGGYWQACQDGPVFKFEQVDWERARW